ncbi:MAG: minichromosome maintenance protein MCM [Thermoplasmata archaeon]|nr:minichromosome maintenance protein MCM [Thermoplasmata archaeon]
MLPEEEQIKIEIVKKKIQELVAKGGTKYLDALTMIVQYEKEHKDDRYYFGWEMEDIEGLNGGMIAQMKQAGLITPSPYRSNKYATWILAYDIHIYEVALEKIYNEINVYRNEVKEEEPLLTDDDAKEFKQILSKYDALDYWHRYVAPAVEGHERVKKLILIMLASPDDTKRSRGRVHILLEGEPGTAKSMFREWVTYDIGAEYASMRSTGAGLTRDMRTGEPGALERANNSTWRVITLEELRDWDREQLEMLKEAMSEGKYPIVGAGVKEIVDAMVRVLACTNEIDSKKFSPQFLNRFDVIVHMERPTKEQANPIIDKMVDDFMIDEDEETNIAKLKKYLWWVKQYNPPFTKEAREQMKLLIKIYKDGKYEDGEKVDLRTTVGSILRIAYTIARLNHREVRPLEDCIRAIELADDKFNKLKLEGIPNLYRKIIEERRKQMNANLV